MTEYHSLRCILPPDPLETLARTGDEQIRAAALDTIALDRRFRLSRAEAAAYTAGFCDHYGHVYPGRRQCQADQL